MRKDSNRSHDLTNTSRCMEHVCMTFVSAPQIIRIVSRDLSRGDKNSEKRIESSVIALMQTVFAVIEYHADDAMTAVT